MDLKRGEFLKMRREELGYTQKQLSDNYLSVATISNIETGAKYVSQEKFNYYCSLLDLNPKQIRSEMQNYKQSKESSLTLIELQLRSIDNDIAFVNPQQALKRLRELEPLIKKQFPGHLGHTEYLRGRCYIRREHTLEKAKKHFRKAIFIFDKHPSIQHTYFKAASLYHLSRIYYFENRLLEALNLVDQGLEALDQCSKENGQKIIYHLLICKVIYLDELERHGEANEVLKIMWNGLERIRTDVFLNMCQIQAEIYKKRSQYAKAINIAQLGIE